MATTALCRFTAAPRCLFSSSLAAALTSAKPSSGFHPHHFSSSSSSSSLISSFSRVSLSASRHHPSSSASFSSVPSAPAPAGGLGLGGGAFDAQNEWVDRWTEEEHEDGDGANDDVEGYMAARPQRDSTGLLVRPKGAAMPPGVYIRKVDGGGQAHGTGKRKGAVASVIIRPGSGTITVNSMLHVEYFQRMRHRYEVIRPFQCTESWCQFDVVCRARGGGLTGQADAIRLGISRALQNFNPAYRRVLKMNGLLTRDSRVVEPKKAGRVKARKLQQWRKR
jgi:small subunit ribosomal protein S9